MGYHMTVLLWATAAVMAVALEPGAVKPKDSTNIANSARGKRTLEFFPPLSRSFGSAERRISTGPTATSRVAISTHYFDRGTPPITIRHQTRVPLHHSGAPIRRQRPHSVPAPPYAVQMEPLVQYSQRDPLYHQQQKQVSSGKTSETTSFNDLQQVKKTSATPSLPLDHSHKSQHVSSSELSSALITNNEDNLLQTSRKDHDPSTTNHILRGPESSDNEPQGGHLSSQHLFPYDESSYYLREPEPIIEIIVKESKESLPPPPTPPSPPPRPPTKEPVQVFYVKYKKDPTKYGKDGGIIYDPPVPAVTPASNTETEEHYPLPSEVSSHPATPPPPPPPTTTLRTIIRPDSETFHGTGLHVTFGDPHDEDSHEDHLQQSAPHPSIVFPHQNFGPRKHFEHQHRPSFVHHDHHKRQPEPFQQQQTSPQHFQPHQQVPFHQQQGPFPPHPPSFQRPFNPPSFHQPRHPQFQQPPPLSQQPPFSQQPPPFRHIPPSVPSPPPPPPLQQQQQQKPSFPHQPPFQQSPFQFQQRQPPSQQPPPHAQRPVLQIQKSQQIPLPDGPPFQEPLQRPSFQQPQSQQRPHFPQQSSVPEQRNPGFPLQQGSGFISPSDQQRNNLQSQAAIQQQLQLQQQQQQQLLQQQQFQQQQQQRQQQLLQQQQRQQLQQQQEQKEQLQQHQFQQNQQQFTQQHQLQQQPPQQQQNKQEQNPFAGEIVKSISQQLHLSPNGPSSQQQLSPTNNKLQHSIQQQPLPHNLPTPSPLFQQQINSQQPAYNQQLLTRQQPQSLLSTPTFNNYTFPQKVFSLVPPSTPAPTTANTLAPYESKTDEKDDKEDDNDKKTVSPSVLASLPDEVPEDLRQQLLSSGILSNADIQILDYDKVGDIPIENLPPEALENFYGAAGAASEPIPSVVAVNGSKAPVEMKVVRFDPTTAEGQEVAEKYVREDATRVDPVVLNDSKYNRYLPLKVSGAQFPLPDVPELRGRNVTSVVVLAPVDYEFQQKQNHTSDDSDRSSRAAPVEVQGVQFVAGDVLKELVKEPTSENYKKWLDKENATSADRQSIVLLVAGSTDGNSNKDIFMYDVATQKVSKLRGELSSAFVEVAEANANSQELDSLAAASDIMEQWEQSPFEIESGDEPSAAASDIYEEQVLPDQEVDLSSSASEQELKYEDKRPVSGDLAVSASELDVKDDSSADKTSNTILVSSGYSKTVDFTAPSL